MTTRKKVLKFDKKGELEVNRDAYAIRLQRLVTYLLFFGMGILTFTFIRNGKSNSVSMDNRYQVPVVKQQYHTYEYNEGFEVTESSDSDSESGQAPLSGMSNTLYSTYAQSDFNLGTIDCISNSAKVIKTNIKVKGHYNFEKTGYTTEVLYVRNKPKKSSKVIDKYYWNSKVKYSDYNKKWGVVKTGKNSVGYIKKEYLSSKKQKYRSFKVSNDKRKSYMDYRTITDRSTRQWRLQLSAETCDFGVRTVQGRYCIAVGSKYTRQVGQYIDVVLKNGEVLKCILGDQKKDIDTNSDHSIGADGGAVEFMVRTSELSSKIRRMGDVRYVSKIWKSPVVEIRVYDENFFD